MSGVVRNVLRLCLLPRRSLIALISLVVVLITPASPAHLPSDRNASSDAEVPTPASGKAKQFGQVIKSSEVVLQPAILDTTWFGGTIWSPDSMRWEATENGIWTFESGVGSHFDHGAPWVEPKDSTLLAYMEGWVGASSGSPEYPGAFRRLSESDFSGGAGPCVGASAGLAGSFSFWAGFLEEEAESLGFATGQGYGNSWDVAIEKTFAYPGSGSVTLEFDYANDTELGYDFTYVTVDTTGSGEEITAASFTGIQSGHASVTFLQGVHLPPGPGNVTIRFRVRSDGAWSDEDGLYPTACGAFAVDNIILSGAIIDGPATFETGDDGWGLSAFDPVIYSEWSNLVHLADLAPNTTGCDCGVADSVLLFDDLQFDDGAHHTGWNIAYSPWIDLNAAGVVEMAGKVLEFDFSWIAQPSGGIQGFFAWAGVQWYPYVNPESQLLTTSPLTQVLMTSFRNYTRCSEQGEPLQVEMASIVDTGAEQLRVAVGVTVGCGIPTPCSGSNNTPWFDNIRVGVHDGPAPPLVPQEDPPAFVLEWGTSGTGPGEFDRPCGIAVGAEIFVVDTENHRVQSFSADGVLLTVWGTLGTGPGQFDLPEDIAVSLDVFVYVADTRNHRVQKFNTTGSFLGEWGSQGTGPGQFSFPRGLAVDAAGNVYVGDTRVQKFDGDGSFIRSWGSQGHCSGQFFGSLGIGVDPIQAWVYVADPANFRIQKFDSTGVFLGKWGSVGTGPGEFILPYDVDLDESGNVYVADRNNSRVQKFDSDGEFLTEWGDLCRLSDGYECDNPSGEGEFNFLEGIAVDRSGNVYVADTDNSRVQQFGTSTVSVPIQPPASPPVRLTLGPGVPNPFWSQTQITYSIPGSEHVELAIYDLQGRRIATVVDEDQGPGEYTVSWDGRIDSGLAASGVYFLRLHAGKATKTQKLMFVR